MSRARRRMHRRWRKREAAYPRFDFSNQPPLTMYAMRAIFERDSIGRAVVSAIARRVDAFARGVIKRPGHLP